ncbi:MAG: LysE/ArgO family amino acid transporter [Deltaproteobacteria bacterium]|jgi:L-lysine exporter family protein LysE/ArgO|nr:LysE/ArgO family amino acid transporter [Deltaproteobacteria bacterium]
MFEAYFTGLALGFSLIVAIGAQNAFVLRQGLRREHVFPICLICSLSDAVLIIFGVTGFHELSVRLIWLEPVLRYGGAAFLFWYGAKSLLAALRSSESLLADTERPEAPLGRTLLICLALTWLNPHVYLDTVVMLGMLSRGFAGLERFFAVGAMSASLIFFFSLGYGARLLRPLFANPGIWRIFEGCIAALMWFIAIKLLLG